MYYVYVLKSLKNNRFYTGPTQNVQLRLVDHNKSSTKSTKNNRPFVLIHQESYDSRSQAYRREMFLKTGKGRDELKKILEST